VDEHFVSSDLQLKIHLIFLFLLVNLTGLEIEDQLLSLESENDNTESQY
jgi:hypothetical protein